jgi:hypothetical protein
MTSITLTRKQLYDRVWTTPIHTLAGELGLSGRGLGKLCARRDIPVPPRGYWAKRAVGQRVSQPSLPFTDRHGQQIRFNGPGPGGPKEDSTIGVHRLVAFESMAANAISVANDLPLSDPLVLKTQRLVARAKLDPHGLVVPAAAGLHVHTSRPLHHRAFRVMQALITAFASRGFGVANTTDGVRVTILDESLGFGIEEGTTTVPHRNSFTEQKLIDRGLGYQIPKVDHVPSGTLSLVITNVRHVRQRWAEGRIPLARMLNRFLIGLIRAALGLKQQRADAERRERERQEAERKRLEEARREEDAERRWREEQGKMERLEQLATVWRRNQEVRRLLADVEAAVGDVNADSELRRWLAWASDHAEQSDPLRRFRERSPDGLTVYYHGYDHEQIAQRGFTEPTVTGYGNEKTKAGVELTCRPPTSSSYARALKLELAEDLLLPFEWVQDSDWYWRVFRVPAAVLNRVLGYGAKTPIQHDGDTEDS